LESFLILKDIPTELLKDEIKPKIKTLYYKGDLSLINSPKIAIVGTRKPNQYTKKMVTSLSSKLSSNGITIVSGSALGVDAIAHQYANTNNTIAVAGTGLDIRYPKINNNLIKNIEQNGLMLSQFKPNTPSQRYNFPIRNELVVALGEILIVTQADINSGTMRSVEFALKMEKQVYVLPHRIYESEGTNQLLKNGDAKAIYDIDEFISNVVGYKNEIKHIDNFLEYCKISPTYDEAVLKYSEDIFKYELLGKIKIENGSIFLI